MQNNSVAPARRRNRERIHLKTFVSNRLLKVPSISGLLYVCTVAEAVAESWGLLPVDPFGVLIRGNTNASMVEQRSR